MCGMIKKRVFPAPQNEAYMVHDQNPGWGWMMMPVLLLQVITAESQAEVSAAVPLPQENILPYPASAYGPAMQCAIGELDMLLDSAFSLLPLHAEGCTASCIEHLSWFVLPDRECQLPASYATGSGAKGACADLVVWQMRSTTMPSGWSRSAQRPKLPRLLLS